MRHLSCVLCVTMIGSILSGCSIAFLQGPPKGTGALERGICDTRMTMPYLDGVTGATITAGVILYEDWDDTANNNRARIVGGLATGAGFLVSALIGSGKVKECRRRIVSESEVAEYLRNIFDMGSVQPQELTVREDGSDPQGLHKGTSKNSFLSM